MNMGSNFWKVVKDNGIQTVLETHIPWNILGLGANTVHLSIAPVVVRPEGIRNKQIEGFKKNIIPCMVEVINKIVLAQNPELEKEISHSLPRKKQFLDMGIKNILNIIVQLKISCISPRNIAIFEEVTGIYQWHYFSITPGRDHESNSPVKETLLELGSIPTIPSCTRIGITYNLTQKEVIKIAESVWYMIVHKHNVAKNKDN